MYDLRFREIRALPRGVGATAERLAALIYGLRFTVYELRITNYFLNYELRITNYELRITNYELEIMRAGGAGQRSGILETRRKAG